MAMLAEVPVAPRSIERLNGVVDDAVVEEATRVLAERAHLMKGRVFWNVNSTAKGGGVAELLQSLLAYARGAGIDARWLTIEGDEEFFRITKRLHHALHGGSGDGSELGEEQSRHYREVLAHNAGDLTARVQPGDIVLLHDPQTAGLVPCLASCGSIVVWRCHVGADRVNAQTKKAWAFLAPWLPDVDAYVFSREAYVPDLLPRERCVIVPPCIDPLSAKNQILTPEVVHAILMHTGLVDGSPSTESRTFRREDGTAGRVDRCADVLRLGAAPDPDVPLVVQVSRWDTLKDPIGVMRGFHRFLEGGGDADLMLAGPNVHAVADDPEGAAVFDCVVEEWRALPHGVRQRVHLANLPMADIEENAAIVNALQRHATVIVQKSLHEGFGLTVTEAMWKSRPVIASAVGGIQDQIAHRQNGMLLQDPYDPDEFASALHEVLEQPGLAARLGAAAHRRVQEHYLCNRHFRQYAELMDGVDRYRASGRAGGA